MTTSSLMASICSAIEDARQQEENILRSLRQAPWFGAPAQPSSPEETPISAFCKIQVSLMDRARYTFLAALREYPRTLTWEEMVACRVLIESHFLEARSRLVRRLPPVHAEGGGGGSAYDAQLHLLAREMDGLFAWLEELYQVPEAGVP